MIRSHLSINRQSEREVRSRLCQRNLDEGAGAINGKEHRLWLVVDKHGYVLDEIVQIHRNTTAAKRSLERLLRKQRCLSKRIIADKLDRLGVMAEWNSVSAAAA